ncbi:MAG: arginine N-succinyltransferase, partial [Sphingomonas sp.]
DQFNAINGHQMIADLMPKHPIYTAMLSEAARSAIGLPHPSGRAAMRMLENEGFSYEHYVDIFDGGPTMTARTDRVKTVEQARERRIVSIDGDDGDESLVAVGRLADFRCAFGMVRHIDGGIALSRDCAEVLGVQAGDEVLQVPRW